MKTVTIENFLAWAFTQELCKVGGGDGMTTVDASNFSVISGVAELGTLIDRSPNIYGVIPGYADEGDPHPDAVAAGDAVRGLARIGFEIPDGWMPFPEWDDEHGLVAGEVARVVAETVLKGDRLGGRALVTLVTGAAILGRGPDWRADAPETRLVSARGKPRWFVRKKAKDSLGRVYEYEADGFDQKKQRPLKGAYRKYELKDPIRGAILTRLDWQLWQDALGHLAGGLRGRLSAHDILPFSPDRQPWVRVARRG